MSSPHRARGRTAGKSCAALLALLVGCSSGDKPGTTPGGQGGAGTGGARLPTGTGGTSGASGTTGNAAAALGGFSIVLTPPTPARMGEAAMPGSTTVQGRVFTGEQPALLQWKQEMAAGDCKLLTPVVPHCDPECASAVCVGDNKCAPQPDPRSVGAVMLTGLRGPAGPVTLNLQPQAGAFYLADAPLSYPAFDEGAELKLTAAGAGSVPAFTLTTKGIAPLVLSGPTPVPIDRNQAVALRWTPGARPELGRIAISLDISHHGGTKGVIECASADTGMLDIPAALVTKLIDLGVAGFPTAKLTRHAPVEAQLPDGRVLLDVVADAVKDVAVAGVTSCNEDLPCPAGKSCGTDLVCK